MKQPQNPTQLYPLFLTSKLEETKKFYLAAGFEVRYDLPQYLQVSYDGGLDLCFALPQVGSNGRNYPAFPGQGVVVSIPTRSADEKAAELRERRLPIVSEPEDKPWGWRSFHVEDPNGVILDFFHVYKEVELPAANEPS